jgi:beta-1,4-mannosyl-glycoprotein beta-1,4-N-acetylglucosaminyltransferase
MDEIRIIDCVIFNNELKVLKARLKYLDGFVNEFVIFESGTTFSGIQKPLYANEAITELQSLVKSKINIWNPDLQEMNTNEYKERWPIELETRKQFLEQLFNAYPNDRIIFTDVDEIPSREQVLAIRNLIHVRDFSIYGINMPTYYNYVNWRVEGTGEKMNCAKTFIASSPPGPTLLRALNAFNDVTGEGAHLSYLGMNSRDVSKKFNEFSHSEFSGQEQIEQFISWVQSKYGIDHLGRYFFEGNGLLKVLNSREIPGPCKFLMEVHPELYNSRSLPSHTKRLIASALITLMRQNASNFNHTHEKLLLKMICNFRVYGFIFNNFLKSLFLVLVRSRP